MPDKQMILDHLRLAEGHVSLGQENILRQRQIVAELERDGHDPIDAGKLLAQFEELQAMHVADRDRLIGELAEAGGD
jgi:hypothetical protein